MNFFNMLKQLMAEYEEMQHEFVSNRIGYDIPQPSTFTTVTTTTFRTRTKINNHKKRKPRYIRNK